jgi:HSP90 family molecular chaperone
MITVQPISNLGIISKSRAKQFKKLIEVRTNLSLIGQFYYFLAFFVSDRVAVTSKHDDD